MDALVRIPVGVVVARSKAASLWIDFTWRPVAVLSGVPAAQAWTVLDEDADTTTFYAGQSDLMLHASDTAQYRDNLSTGQPKLWVVLRPTGAEPPFEVVRVTADGSEGEGFTAAGDDVVDQVPMPEPIWSAVEKFVAEHHVEQTFYKRERKRADPNALGRRGRIGEDKE
jgi:hypothetical protein